MLVNLDEYALTILLKQDIQPRCCPSRTWLHLQMYSSFLPPILSHWRWHIVRYRWYDCNPNCMEHHERCHNRYVHWFGIKRILRLDNFFILRYWSEHLQRHIRRIHVSGILLVLLLVSIFCRAWFLELTGQDDGTKYTDYLLEQGEKIVTNAVNSAGAYGSVWYGADAGGSVFNSYSQGSALGGLVAAAAQTC